MLQIRSSLRGVCLHLGLAAALQAQAAAGAADLSAVVEQDYRRPRGRPLPAAGAAGAYLVAQPDGGMVERSPRNCTLNNTTAIRASTSALASKTSSNTWPFSL